MSYNDIEFEQITAAYLQGGRFTVSNSTSANVVMYIFIYFNLQI